MRHKFGYHTGNTTIREAETAMRVMVNRYKPWLVSLVLFTADVIAIGLSFLLAYYLRTWLIPILGGQTNLRILLPMLFILATVTLASFAFSRMYPGIGRTGVVEVKEILNKTTIAFVITGLAIFIMGYADQFSRVLFVLFWAFSCGLLSVFRVVLHNRGSLLSWWLKPVCLVGTAQDIGLLTTYLRTARRMAYLPVVGLVTSGTESLYDQAVDIIAMDFSPDNVTHIQACGIKTVFYIPDLLASPAQQKHTINLLNIHFSELFFVMMSSPLASLQTTVIDIEGLPTLRVSNNLLSVYRQRVKRLFDLFICTFSSLFTIPLFILCSLLIKLDSPGPTIFIQQRLGKNGQPFSMYKFRTMVNNAEEQLTQLLTEREDLREEYQQYHKLQNDPRITRMGRFLRKYSLDELPQMLNVLRGQMSLVGPRAYLPGELTDMGEDADIILRVTPGLTGWWQVMGRNQTSFEDRLHKDVFYIYNFSIWMDCFILAKTFWIFIKGSGA